MKNIVSVFLGFALILSAGAFADEKVEKKKVDSFALSANTPLVGFGMAIASTEAGKNTCYNQGDIGIDKDGLIVSCQSGSWKTLNKGAFSGHFATNIYNGCMVANAITKGCSCPSGSSSRATGQYSSYTANDSNSYICL